MIIIATMLRKIGASTKPIRTTFGSTPSVSPSPAQTPATLPFALSTSNRVPLNFISSSLRHGPRPHPVVFHPAACRRRARPAPAPPWPVSRPSPRRFATAARRRSSSCSSRRDPPRLHRFQFGVDPVGDAQLGNLFLQRAGRGAEQQRVGLPFGIIGLPLQHLQALERFPR